MPPQTPVKPITQTPDEQKAIVQRMIDAGESEQNIATVIQHFGTFNPPENIANRPRPSNLASDVVNSGLNVATNAADAASQPVFHPLDFLSSVVKAPVNILQAHGQQAQQAYDAFQRGDRSEGTLRGIASIIPIVGPLFASYADADQAGKEKIAGDVIGGLAFGAGLPKLVSGIAGASTRASEALGESAVNSEARAIGSTKGMADQARFVGEEMLKRGISGTRSGMLKDATAAVEKTGQSIADEIARATQRGEEIDNTALINHLDDVKRSFYDQPPSGPAVVREGYQGVVDQLDALRTVLARYGQKMPVAQAQQFKQAWADITAKAGLYGAKAAQPAADTAKAYAFKEAANGLRKALSSNTTLDALNKEYEFQIGLKSVLEDTANRTLGKNGSLGPMLAGAAGAAAGSGLGLPTAGLGALLGAGGLKLIQSPYWQSSVSAPLKSALADALVSGAPSKVSAVLKSMVASLPAKARPLFTAATGAASGAADMGLVGNTGRMGGPGGR